MSECALKWVCEAKETCLIHVNQEARIENDVKDSQNMLK